LGFLGASLLPELLLFVAGFVGADVPDRISSELDELAKGSGLVGAVITLWVLLRCLGYVAQPERPRRGGPPGIAFPPLVSAAGRDRASLNIFWYRQARLVGVLSAAYPYVILFVSMAFFTNGEGTAPANAEDITNVWGQMLVVVVILGAPVCVGVRATRIVQRRTVPAAAMLQILEFVKQPATFPAPTDAQWVNDPQVAARLKLRRITVALSLTARLIDANQPRDSAPHPMATVLRGSAHMLQDYLVSARSLQPTTPTVITELLEQTVAAIAGPREPELYQRLSALVGAFDDGGAPAVQLRPRIPGRIARAGDITAHFIDRAASTVAGLSGILVAAATVMLFALGHLSVDKLMEFFKK
jgi:hypothetical protein